MYLLQARIYFEEYAGLKKHRRALFVEIHNSVAKGFFKEVELAALVETVFTEDEEIAEVAREWGAEVPFLRLAELAGDEASVGEALSYTINQLGGHGPGRAFVTLYPTSPFRTPAFIDEMLPVLCSRYDSVTTVKEIHIDPRHAYILDEKSNELINLYGENGSIPPWKTDYRSYAVFHATWPRNTDQHYYHVIEDKCMLIDIDTPKDLRWAEAVIRNGLFDFGFE